MKLFTADYGEEPKQPGVKVEHFDVSTEHPEVAKLKAHIDFLVDTFTQRDASQRNEIEMLKSYNDRLRNANAQQAAQIAYFQAVGEKGQQDFMRTLPQ